MKLLVFADLHIRGYGSLQIKWVKRAVDKHRPDVVLIAGDVCESQSLCVEPYNPFIELEGLGVPTVFCLGNHEFAYRTTNETIKQYAQWQGLAKNVWCLDVCCSVEINGVLFVGNVLWYDGSLGRNWNGKIVQSWLDSSILCFDPIMENKICLDAIRQSLTGNEDKTRVLLTHCVPDCLLNWFSFNAPDSVYNAYSGIKHLPDDIHVDYAYCGHTHRPMEATIDECKYVNVGCNLAKKDFRYLVEEIENPPKNQTTSVVITNNADNKGVDNAEKQHECDGEEVS